MIEVKQALTSSLLERNNDLAFEKALESALSEQPEQVQDAFGSSVVNYSGDLTQTYISSNQNNDATNNGKPIINLAVEQQLQTIIFGWELTQNNPINYSLGLDQLFEDPEGDLLTTRIWLENANGLSVLNQGKSCFKVRQKPSIKPPSWLYLHEMTTMARKIMLGLPHVLNCQR